jgi:hypothetical protein
MGMRRNIQVIYEEETVADGGTMVRVPENRPSVYFYTHWGAEGLEETLASSLERARDRWDDETYLARVIFTDMTADAGDDVTGYGIAPYVMEEEFTTLVVDMKAKTVNGTPYEDFIAQPSMYGAYVD